MATKTPAKRAAAGRNTKKKGGFLSRINWASKRVQLFAFISVFAVLGGGYTAFRSFAAVAPYNARLYVYVDGYTGPVTMTSNKFLTPPHNYPQYTVGDCPGGATRTFTFSVTRSRMCKGLRFGPFALTAGTVPGYKFEGWSGNCYMINGNKCEMDFWDGNRTKTVRAKYSKLPDPRAATPVASSGCRTQTLSQGSRGTCVQAIQWAVTRSTYAVAVDGIFGSGTKSGVQAFQRARRLSPDGVVGTNTWNAICTFLRSDSGNQTSASYKLILQC